MKQHAPAGISRELVHGGSMSRKAVMISMMPIAADVSVLISIFVIGGFMFSSFSSSFKSFSTLSVSGVNPLSIRSLNVFSLLLARFSVSKPAQTNNAALRVLPNSSSLYAASWNSMAVSLFLFTFSL